MAHVGKFVKILVKEYNIAQAKIMKIPSICFLL
jgi:hypothetical protein